MEMLFNEIIALNCIVKCGYRRTGEIGVARKEKSRDGLLFCHLGVFPHCALLQNEVFDFPLPPVVSFSRATRQGDSCLPKSTAALSISLPIPTSSSSILECASIAWPESKCCSA